MLILTSNGLSSESIIKNLKPLFENISKAVIVTTASEYKKNDWNIPRLKKELEIFDFSVDFFDFDVDNPEQLFNYDVIEIIGGNPFYLLKSMRNSNFNFLINRLIIKKILIGISAGSLVLQKNINLVALYSPELNNKTLLTDYTGMGITSLEVLPHYSKFLNKYNRFEEIAKEYELNNNCKIIRLNDGQCIIDNKNSFKVI
ncbi:MAG: Type 1 glutamine amidotransferase-like domain-containing protein [Clostridiales bacterium]